MKKIINDPMAFVDEMLEGILAAHPNQLKATKDPRALVRADAPVQGKVAILTGGGSGHLPVFLGYVGVGLADGCAVGNVFSSPSAETMYEATLATNGGAGALYLYGNYSGDVMNFDMAAEMADMDGIHVQTVLVDDDVASAPVGATARRGQPVLCLQDRRRGGRRRRLAGRGRARHPGGRVQHPVHGRSALPLHRACCGRAHLYHRHGEAGVRRGPLEPADAIADALTGAVTADLKLARGDRVAVLVNGLGATPLEELYVLYRRTRQILDADGIDVYRSYVGEFATSLEMAGASISLLRLDENLARLLDAPAISPFFVQAAGVGAPGRRG